MGSGDSEMGEHRSEISRNPQQTQGTKKGGDMGEVRGKTEGETNMTN